MAGRGARADSVLCTMSQRRSDQPRGRVANVPSEHSERRIRDVILSRRKAFLTATLLGLPSLSCCETDASRGATPSAPSALSDPAPSNSAPSRRLEDLDHGSATACLGFSQPDMDRPTVSVQVSAVSPPSASRQTAGVLSHFRRCYQRELKANLDAAGSMELHLTLDSGGDVAGIRHSVRGNLGTCADCVVGLARAMRFDPPPRGRAEVSFTVNFAPKS